MKRWQRNLILFLYCLVLVFAFELTDYFIEHNLLSNFYVATIEFMFLALGNAGAYISYKFNKVKKGKKK